MNYFMYFTSFHSSREIWTQEIDLAPNVWLHSSVGKATNRQRGGHGFESRWSPDFFQASSFQLLKLENSLQWSFFTFTNNTVFTLLYLHYFLIEKIKNYCPRVQENAFLTVGPLFTWPSHMCLYVTAEILDVMPTSKLNDSPDPTSTWAHIFQTLCHSQTPPQQVLRYLSL